jgi:hypothetical protein
MSWFRWFDEPIELPDGWRLRTLRNAGRYVEALHSPSTTNPSAARNSFSADGRRGSLPVIFANITLRKALDAGQPNITSEPRKKAAKKYRIVR